MTFASDAIRKAGPYVGNSIITVFAFTFKTFSANDLSVTLLTTATSIQQLLVLNTDYTVQLNANQDTNPGGTVTTIGAISPIPNTQTLTISGNVMADTQGTDLITPGPWAPNDVENMVDRAMIAVQQLRDRAIKFPVIDSVAPIDLPPAEARKNTTFIFDANGQVAVGAVTTVVIPTTIGAIPFGTGAGVAVDAAKLFWDNTNKRLGIGNAAPTQALDVTGTGKFSASVVTPLIANSVQNSFTQVRGGTTDAVDAEITLFGSTHATLPNQGFYDAVKHTFRSAAGVLSGGIVTVPVVDSGSTGSLSLKTNNGTISAVFGHTPSAVNFLSYFAGATGQAVDFLAGGETNVAMFYGTKGTGTHFFVTGATNDNGSGAVTQAQVLHIASATRSVRLGGSNGANPFIDTSAGGLDINSVTVRFPSISTTAVAANATLNAVGSNDLLRSTSSVRYKNVLRDFDIGAARALITKARPVVFESKSISDYAGEEHVGFLAEDIAKIDPRFTTYDVQGRPDWVQYPTFVVPLTLMAADHERRLAALEARIH